MISNFFCIDRNIASIINCSSLPDFFQESCLQLNQGLEQILGLFFAAIAIMFVLAGIGIEINATAIIVNIIFSSIGIAISRYMGIDYALDVIFLILSFVTGKYANII